MREIEAMSHVYNAFQMFLSLHQPVTKYQKPNLFFVVVEETAWAFLFLNCKNNKYQNKHLLCIWFLVTS